MLFAIAGTVALAPSASRYDEEDGDDGSGEGEQGQVGEEAESIP